MHSFHNAPVYKHVSLSIFPPKVCIFMSQHLEECIIYSVPWVLYVLKKVHLKCRLNKILEHSDRSLLLSIFRSLIQISLVLFLSLCTHMHAQVPLSVSKFAD